MKFDNKPLTPEEIEILKKVTSEKSVHDFHDEMKKIFSSHIDNEARIKVKEE
jgi:hypothetical protein